MRCCLHAMLVIWLFSLAGTGVAADPPLPPEALKLVEKHDAAVDAAKKQYDAAVAKADLDTSKELSKCLTSATKAGDLGAANAIKKKIDELTSKANGQPPVQALVGQWQVEYDNGQKRTLTITDDLEAKAIATTWGSVGDKGDITLIKDRSYSVQWSERYETFRLNDNGTLAVVHWDRKGGIVQTQGIGKRVQ